MSVSGRSMPVGQPTNGQFSDDGPVSSGRQAGRSPSLPGTPLPAGVLCLAWMALVVIGIVGRLYQPAYGVTPLAGIGLCAGALFFHPLVAASVPLVALAASNVALPGGGSYGSWAMAAIVYGAFAWPVLMGGLVRRHRIWGAVGGALASSLVFFLATNLGHWWLTNDYPHTAAGLLDCFTLALPFYRWMPVGDLVWSLALSSGLAIFPALAQKMQRSPA